MEELPAHVHRPCACMHTFGLQPRQACLLCSRVRTTMLCALFSYGAILKDCSPFFLSTSFSQRCGDAYVEYNQEADSRAEHGGRNGGNVDGSGHGPRGRRRRRAR